MSTGVRQLLTARNIVINTDPELEKVKEVDVKFFDVS